MQKSAVVALALLESAQAFSGVAVKAPRAAVAMKGGLFEDVINPGPQGYFDPLGIVADGDKENFERLRLGSPSKKLGRDPANDRIFDSWFELFPSDPCAQPSEPLHDGDSEEKMRRRKPLLEKVFGPSASNANQGFYGGRGQVGV